MSGVFKDHKRHYNKHEYSMFLDRQVEEQKRNKMQHKYMSEEEYRYNANQLNVTPSSLRKPSKAATFMTGITTVPWGQWATE